MAAACLGGNRTCPMSSIGNRALPGHDHDRRLRPAHTPLAMHAAGTRGAAWAACCRQRARGRLYNIIISFFFTAAATQMRASLSATVHCPSLRYSHSVASRCPLAIEASGLARAGGAVHASVALKAGVAASVRLMRTKFARHHLTTHAFTHALLKFDRKRRKQEVINTSGGSWLPFFAYSLLHLAFNYQEHEIALEPENSKIGQKLKNLLRGKTYVLKS